MCCTVWQRHDGRKKESTSFHLQHFTGIILITVDREAKRKKTTSAVTFPLCLSRPPCPFPSAGARGTEQPAIELWG